MAVKAAVARHHFLAQAGVPSTPAPPELPISIQKTAMLSKTGAWAQSQGGGEMSERGGGRQSGRRGGIVRASEEQNDGKGRRGSGGGREKEKITGTLGEAKKATTHTPTRPMLYLLPRGGRVKGRQ